MKKMKIKSLVSMILGALLITTSLVYNFIPQSAKAAEVIYKVELTGPDLIVKVGDVAEDSLTESICDQIVVPYGDMGDTHPTDVCFIKDKGPIFTPFNNRFAPFYDTFNSTSRYYYDAAYWLDSAYSLPTDLSTLKVTYNGQPVSMVNSYTEKGYWLLQVYIPVTVLDADGNPITYPDEEPIPVPTQEPTPEPTEEPTPEPTEEPTPEPTEEPTPEPTEEPTPEPTEEPTPEPTEEPTPEPTEEPGDETDDEPIVGPDEEPTPEPTEEPTPEPTEEPTPEPTEEPTPEPTEEPTPEPTEEPTPVPTEEPTPVPTEEPTPIPTEVPTSTPTPTPVEEVIEEPEIPQEEPVVPKTNDSNPFVLPVALSVIALAGLAVSKKRKVTEE